MPFLIDLSEMLTHSGMRQATDVDVPCGPELQLDCTTPFKGRLAITNTGNVLVVQGTVSGGLKSTCPRCLTDVVTRIDAPIDEEFSVENNMVTGLADDDTGFADPAVRALIHENLLNVTELTRQAIVLATPVDPLCREDCKGLCPQCGANWNDAPCACEPEIASPFAVLAGLYNDGESAGPES